MIELLTENDEKEENHVPEVYLIVGVNGVGKTTTIGKLAYQMSKAGKKYYWRQEILIVLQHPSS